MRIAQHSMLLRQKKHFSALGFWKIYTLRSHQMQNLMLITMLLALTHNHFIFNHMRPERTPILSGKSCTRDRKIESLKFICTHMNTNKHTHIFGWHGFPFSLGKQHEILCWKWQSCRLPHVSCIQNVQNTTTHRMIHISIWQFECNAVEPTTWPTRSVLSVLTIL